MNELNFSIREAVNEPIKEYKPGSKEKISLKKTIEELKSKIIDIPIIINGKEITTNNTEKCVIPHDHKHILAHYHKAGKEEVQMAIESNLEAWEKWSKTSLEDRIKIFHKMADLLAGPYRDLINASTMLGQSKNAYQAEIDAACELIDFFNFNCEYLYNIHKQQPKYSPEGMKNSTEYRALEGFIFSVAPFNFTSIAANLMKLFKEAGLPDGVINFIPGSGKEIGNIVLNHSDLAGIHFTGSTEVFQSMWAAVGNNIKQYKTYPRIVGETGGKDFILAHKSANRKALSTAMIRGAFEYQGQKCSAASRCYLPKSVWLDIEQEYQKDVFSIKIGDVENFQNFMNAVIDENSFDNIVSYIEYAKKSQDATIITGGNYDKNKGYFIEPTTILTTNPHFKTMEEEIFGPVLTIYLYDCSWEEVCKLVDSTSQYALTGAIFADDEEKIESGRKYLTHSAGNFYINDKPTGAVVGQQPFGGSRASGTNDKAGAPANLLRWTSQRTIKQTFNSPEDYKYPFMSEE